MEAHNYHVLNECDAQWKSIHSKTCEQVTVGTIIYYSRSYAEDVTSVTSGASQGPHSFNLVFVCLFVCLFVSRLVLSRICPVLYRTSKDILFVCLYSLFRVGSPKQALA